MGTKDLTLCLAQILEFLVAGGIARRISLYAVTVLVRGRSRMLASKKIRIIVIEYVFNLVYMMQQRLPKDKSNGRRCKTEQD